MEKFLLQSDLNQLVQDEMAGQAPGDAKIYRAMNAEVDNIKVNYNVGGYKRAATVSMIPGTAYLVSSLISDDDVESIEYIRYVDSDYVLGEMVDIDEKSMDNHVIRELMRDEYSLYIVDGKQYLMIQTFSQETAAVNFVVKYFSVANALSGTDYLAKVDGTAGALVLIPTKFKDLVVLGTVKRLLYQVVGDDGNTQLSIISNRYTSMLQKLGISREAKAPKNEVRKIKMRKP